MKNLKSDEKFVDGSLALKIDERNMEMVENDLSELNSISDLSKEDNIYIFEKPKTLKLKKKNNYKIFCGCWQIANQEDAC